MRETELVAVAEMPELVSNRELADWLDELFAHRPVMSLVEADSGAYRAIYEVRLRAKPWVSLRRADTILSALGRPDVLQCLTSTEG